MKYPTTFELPTTDTMTGLLSSAYFRHLLRESLMPQAGSSGDPLSLLLFDIDYFDQVNKTHGHECGDQVINKVAQTVQETMPETAAISRYGGDELAVALPDTRLDDAFTLAEELRASRRQTLSPTRC